jgi:hypothetical protein
MGKVVMSLCHIWFGVARSNRRGAGVGFLRACFGRVASPAVLSCWRTVSGLALRQKSRRRICEIRRTPWRGSARFNATIFAPTAAGSFAPAPPGFASCSPASPCWR